MKRVAATLAALAVLAVVAHATLPAGGEFLVGVGAVLLLAHIAARPERVSVRRHLERTAGQAVLGVASALGWTGLVVMVVAVTLAAR